MNRYTIGALILFIVQGCSSTGVDTDNSSMQSSQKIKAKHNVYAKFVKGDDDVYYFSEYAFWQMPNSVNLNYLSHNFETKESNCSKGLLDDGDPLCSENAHFTKVAMDGGDVMRNTLGNVFIAFASAGLGTSLHYTVQFDHDSFKKSLNIALKKIDRRKLIEDANRAVSENKANLLDTEKQFELFKKELETKSAKATFVKNNSGFLVSPPVVKTKIERDVDTRLTIRDRWKSIAELSQSLTAQVERSRNRAKLSLSCPKLSSFNFKTDGCSQTWSYDSIPEIKPITYTVSSAKHYLFRPQIKLSDKYLTVSSDAAGRLLIENNTNFFITVNSLSLYLGEDIQTLTNLGIEIPPGAASRAANMSRFSLYSTTKNRSLWNIVKKDLSKKITVGGAMKYTLIDKDEQKTIYKTDLIKYDDMSGKLI